MEALIGNIVERLFTDKRLPRPQCAARLQFRVFLSGQKRRVTPKIKRELRRRSAVEPASATSGPSTEWAAITSGTARAMPSMRSSPLSVTT
jgi:hypothetical protein